MVILKFVSLVLAVWFTVLNFGLMFQKQEVPTGNFLVQALSIATFIFIQFNLF